MNKQGQIFLLLTILAVTFLLTISTVLLNIQVSEYSQPSADSGKLFEAWDNTVSSTVQIMSVQVAYNTNNGIPTGATNDLGPHLANLEQYLNSKGLVASIEEVAGTEQYVSTSLITSSSASLNVTLDIYIATSSGAKLDGTVNLNVTYSAQITGNILVVSKIVNTNPYFLNSANVVPQTTGSVQNNGNGSYQLAGADTYDITTSDFVILQVQLP